MKIMNPMILKATIVHPIPTHQPKLDLATSYCSLSESDSSPFFLLTSDNAIVASITMAKNNPIRNISINTNEINPILFSNNLFIFNEDYFKLTRAIISSNENIFVRLHVFIVLFRLRRGKYFNKFSNLVNYIYKPIIDFSHFI